MAETSGTIERTGLFLVAYDCTTGKPGAPQLELHLGVSTVTHTVTGLGSLAWTVKQPILREEQVAGSYHDISLFAGGFLHAMSLTGCPVVAWPPGVGPVFLPDLKAQLMLAEDWQSGTATYSFTDGDGNWHTVSDVPVRRSTPPAVEPEAVDGLTERVLVRPEAVEATYADGVLTITAWGEEDGLTDFRVFRAQTEIWPPEFSITARRTPVIGPFPWSVRREFDLGSQPDYVVLRVPDGEEKVPVNAIP